jgi:hypothetical protein
MVHHVTNHFGVKNVRLPNGVVAEGSCARETTIQASVWKILLKQFARRYCVTKERESGDSKLHGITTLICFEIVCGLFNYPLPNLDYKA